MLTSDNTSFNATTAISALRTCVIEKKKGYYEKGARNKKGAIIVQIIIIGFSILTSVFIGWKIAANQDQLLRLLSNFALVCSTVTAGLTLFYNFFDYKNLWVQYKVGRSEMESLIAELDYLEACGVATVTKEQLDDIFKKYLKLCSGVTESYQQIRLAKDGTAELK